MKHIASTVFDASVISSFAVARSDWLNAIARLELEIGACLARVSGGCERGMTLSQRLNALAAIKPSHRCSKADVEKLASLKNECEPLLRLRASIVHSEMMEGCLGTEPVAFFQNVADARAGIPLYAVLTAAEFERTQKAIRALAQKFAAISPSSPPPPKKAAAGGP